jgi:formate dehydrogenase subunit gamma
MTRYIQRHSLLKRVIHGTVAVSCFFLIFGGLILFVPALAQAVGDPFLQFLRVMHRVFAVSFIAAPLIGLIVPPKGFVHIVKNLTAKWDEDDKKFMALFPKYLFAPKTTHMPPQHEVKSGQRLADGALLLASFAIAASGVILWLGTTRVSPQAFRLALLVHDVSFFAIAIIMCAHLYLGAGIFQPYRGLHRLMFGDGRVAEGPARYHWGYWAEEEFAKGTNIVEVED